MRKTRCRFLVPVRYNDGREVEPEMIVRIKVEIETRFGAYRVSTPQEGSWQGQVEETVEYEVCINPRRIPELRELVLTIGRMLGQKAMYFDAPEPSVLTRKRGYLKTIRRLVYENY